MPESPPDPHEMPWIKMLSTDEIIMALIVARRERDAARTALAEATELLRDPSCGSLAYAWRTKREAFLASQEAPRA